MNPARHQDRMPPAPTARSNAVPPRGQRSAFSINARASVIAPSNHHLARSNDPTGDSDNSSRRASMDAIAIAMQRGPRADRQGAAGHDAHAGRDRG